VLRFLCLSNECDSRNHAKAFDIEDGADTLCFWFDDSLNVASDFYLLWISDVQQTVKEICCGAFQPYKPQSYGSAQSCAVMINVRYGVANQSTGAFDFYLFYQLGKTALAKRAGG
jgi:hypothetical protein